MHRYLVPLLVGVAASGAPTEDRVQRSIQLQSATRLALTAEVGSIRAMPGASPSLEVEVYFRGDPPSRAEFDNMLRDFSLEVTNLGSEIRVAGTFKNGWRTGIPFNWGRWCRNSRCLEYRWLRQIEYRLSAPEPLSVDLSTSGGSITVGDLKREVTARTSGGSLDFGRIEGPVNGRTSGGSITLRGVRGRADVRTSGGSIRIDEAAGDVEAHTSGGSIDINRTTGRVSVRTSGGGITVRETAGPVDAATSGGGIEVRLLSGKGYDIDAATSGGGVSSDFPVQVSGRRSQRRLQGPVNGGGPLVRLRTSGGSIRIRSVG
jgi:hypothetical protein